MPAKKKQPKPDSDAQDQLIGDRLRELRESNGWSLREVATKAGVNHGYLSQLERGDVSQPAPAMLHKLSEGYDEPFGVLMRWAGYIEEDDSGITSNQARALSYLGDDVSDDELEAIKAVLTAIRMKRPTFSMHAASLDGELPDDDRQRIRQHVLALLRKADAVGVFPTPLEQVMEVAQLVAAGDITLDLEERRQLRKRFGSLVDLVLDRLQGAIHFKAREVWVKSEMHVLRRRFVTAHEIGHDVLPWQRDVLAYLDDHERLRSDVRLVYERQANQAAIELLAQGDALRKEADDSRLTVRLISELSAKYQISMQATARRTVEESRQEAALAVRFRGSSGHLGPNHVYCSRSFATRFGWDLSGAPVEAIRAANEAAATFGVAEFNALDRTKSFVPMGAERVDTTYALLSLFTPAPRPGGIRRLLRVTQ